MYVDNNIVIFMPAYNSGRFIKEVYSRIPLSLGNVIRKIWIINDGSTDNTLNEAEYLKSQDNRIEIVSFALNKGYGAVVKYALKLARESGADYTICLHTDGQYPPEMIPDMLNAAIHGKVDVLQGSRHRGKGALEGGMPLYKYVAGKILVAMENIVFGLKQSDYHSGFLCYSRKLLDTVDFSKLSPSFDIDLEIIASARAARLSVSEIAIPTRYADEKSYLNPINYGLRVLFVLVKYVGRYYGKIVVKNQQFFQR